MIDILLEVAVHLFVFCAVFYLVYSFLSDIGSAAAELQEKHGTDVDTTFSELYISLPPQHFLSVKLACFAILFFIGYVLVDEKVGLAMGAFGFFIPVLILNKVKAKRQLLLEEQLVDGLELLKNGLKSGLTIQQATELLVKEFPPPLSQEFSLVLAETRLGVDFIQALHNMANRLNSNIVQILASGVAITKKCGGDLTEIFSNLADTIREQSKIDGKLKAVTAQGRTQGLVLGVMPFALLVVMFFIDRNHVETLFGNQIGVYAFVGVIFMVLIAQLWIRKLLDIDV